MVKLSRVSGGGIQGARRLREFRRKSASKRPGCAADCRGRYSCIPSGALVSTVIGSIDPAGTANAERVTVFQTLTCSYSKFAKEIEHGRPTQATATTIGINITARHTHPLLFS